MARRLLTPSVRLRSGTPGVVTTSSIVISQPGSYVLVGPITVAGGDGMTISPTTSRSTPTASPSPPTPTRAPAPAWPRPTPASSCATRASKICEGAAFPGFGLVATQVQASSVRYAPLASIRSSLVSDCSVSLYSGSRIQGDDIRGCTIGYGYTAAPNAVVSGNVIDICTAGISGGVGFVRQIVMHS